jgi:hypothetical protein
MKSKSKSKQMKRFQCKVMHFISGVQSASRVGTVGALQSRKAGSGHSNSKSPATSAACISEGCYHMQTSSLFETPNHINSLIFS